MERLEHEPEGKLHRSSSALLVLRGNRCQTGIQHLSRLAERDIGIGRIDVSEVRVIEEIECFRPESKD